MLEELEQLSLAVGAVSRTDVERVVDAVNQRLVRLVHAQVAKLYWREEAEEGSILEPLAYVNNTRYPDPRKFPIGDESNGVLSWVFHQGKPLWLSGLKDSDLDAPILNLATGNEIPPEQLDVRSSPDLDAIITVPILIRGHVHGVYSIEALSAERFNERILDLLRHLTNALAPLLWNADVYSFDLQKTTRAVSKFLYSVRDFTFDPVWLEQDIRSGFVARPFGSEFTRAHEILSELLKSKGVIARHYEPMEGRGLVIDEIMRQVRNSHFCICDITSANANVMAEVGMVMILRKPMMLIRKKGDETPIPFDLGHQQVYHYEVAGGELQVWNPAEAQFRPFSPVLDDFINQLPTETGFFSAKRHRS
jgi:GAF domain